MSHTSEGASPLFGCPLGMSYSDMYRVELLIAEYSSEQLGCLDIAHTSVDILRQSNMHPEEKVKNLCAEAMRWQECHIL